MNVALVNTNTIKPPLSPIGLLSLAAFLRSRNHRVRLLDPCLSSGGRSPQETLLSGLKSAPKPDLIGFSIRNIDSTQMEQPHYFLPEILGMIRAARSALPGIPVVLGGAGFSLEPLEIMELIQAEYGIVGEGETPLHELLLRLEARKEPRDIPGLVWKDPGGRYRQNPARNMSPESLSRLPFQAVDLVEYQSYFKMGGMASVQTKRGCALKCGYCTYPLIEGRAYRLIAPARVVDELEFFARRGYDYFHFADSVFNVPRGHALDICREIVKRSLRVKWHAYMSPYRFDEELLDRLIQAGNDGILFGVDACSEKMLLEFGKNFTQKDIHRASEACHRKGMEFSFHILIGAPGETLETVQETLSVIDEIKPTAVFITQGIRVYRGTPIHGKLLRKGLIRAEQSLLEPYFYFSDELPPDISQRILDFAEARDFVYCAASTKSPQTNQELMRLYEENFRGPQWRILRKARELAKRNV